MPPHLITPALQARVDHWLDLDQNEDTRNEVLHLLHAKKYLELANRMMSRIEFGTAGLRGRMEAGWGRMNDLIIIQTSQENIGLCDYVLSNVQDAATRGVVLGYDHRHHSKKWAILSANVFASRNMKVLLCQGFVHTPLVPFSVRKLGAACGVMITASHNPKHDNGYKVYWENAVQIIAPHDKGISEAIGANTNLGPWNTSEGNPLIEDITENVQSLYFSYLQTFKHPSCRNRNNVIRFVNTSLHGVGHKFLFKAFESLDLEPFVAVEEQKDPDPDFPTVPFPNPEEAGALNKAFEVADGCGAQYVLAQDPDADRFCAAEKRELGRWHTFTGDQLGVLFAAQLIQQYKNSGKPIERLAIVSSTVSSRMIESMAKIEGFKYVECLTGFKYIGNVALDLEKNGDYFVDFGYEEAIGYMFGNTIRDKDGVAASIIFAQLAITLNDMGLTVYGYLQTLYERYGHYQTKNGYFICSDPNTKTSIFRRLRFYREKEMTSYPIRIADLDIYSIRDLTTGYESTNPPSFASSLPLSGGDMITFKARSRPNESQKKSITLTIRASGTEPKIKYYLEGNNDDPSSTEEMLVEILDDMSLNWIEADKHGLLHPQE